MEEQNKRREAEERALKRAHDNDKPSEGESKSKSKPASKLTAEASKSKMKHSKKNSGSGGSSATTKHEPAVTGSQSNKKLTITPFDDSESECLIGC